MQRARLGRFLLTVIMAMLVGLLAAPIAVAAGLPADLDVDAIAADIADDGVAVVDSQTSESALREVVAEAKDKDIDLGLVVIGHSVDPPDVQSLANQLMVRTGKSVLVIARNYLKGESKEISGAENAKAEQAAIAARDDVTAARAYLGALHTTSHTWLWVLGGIVVVIVLAGIWLRARRARNAGKPADPAATTAALRDRLGGLSGQIVEMSGRIDLAGRPDLTQRFNEASATYAQLLQRLAQPLDSQRAADASKAEIDALASALQDLETELSRHLPGMQPPAPAG